MSSNYVAKATPSNKRKPPQARGSTIDVYLRLRPLEKGQPTLFKVNDQQVQTLPPDSSNPQAYKFTKVFDGASQAEIFDEVGKPLVKQFLDGKDGLIFSYGITGSGKTYTMEGVRGNSGLIFRTIKCIFNSIGSQQTERGSVVTNGHNSYLLQDQEQLYPNLELTSATSKYSNYQSDNKNLNDRFKVEPEARYCLFLSLIELYNKRLIDLFEEFGPRADYRKREIRSDKQKISYVANATEVEVKSAEEAEKFYRLGVSRRRTGATALNQESSRGHCVLTLKLVRCDRSIEGSTLLTSQLCLVDLAGSERAKRSHATGEALQEACSINNSLGALRKCVRALRDGEPTNSIQYREYNLTRLFKSYFEGRGSICMILCVRPTRDDFSENNTAMEFGLVAQDVVTDYASPPKRTRCADDLDLDIMDLGPNMRQTLESLDPNLDPLDKLKIVAGTCKRHSQIRQKYADRVTWTIKEFRKTLVSISDDWHSLKQKEERLSKEMTIKEKEIELLKSSENVNKERNENLQSQLDDIKFKMERIEREKLYSDDLKNDFAEYIASQPSRLKRVNMSPKKAILDPVPSAPIIDHQQSSSPETRDPSTTETSESNVLGTNTTTSTEDIRQQRVSRPRTRGFMLSSPNRGEALAADPNHSRSHSCSCMRWIDHKPAGTIDTSTSIKPRIKNRRSVKVLRTSDILRKDAAGYSIIHQNAEPNGDVTSSLYTGKIVSTVTGGAQVILNDVEVLKRQSPVKRRRAASDAH